MAMGILAHASTRFHLEMTWMPPKTCRPVVHNIVLPTIIIFTFIAFRPFGVPSHPAFHFSSFRYRPARSKECFFFLDRRIIYSSRAKRTLFPMIENIYTPFCITQYLHTNGSFRIWICDYCSIYQQLYRTVMLMSVNALSRSFSRNQQFINESNSRIQLKI